MKWVLKTSSVRIATGDQDVVYRSIQDAPPELRERIKEVLQGPDSETIFIANQEAYDRLFKTSKEVPPNFRNVEMEADRSKNEIERHLTPSARRVLVAMFSAIGALWLIWALFIQIGR